MLGQFPYPTFLPLMIDRFLIGILVGVVFFEKQRNRRQLVVLILILLVGLLGAKKILLIASAFLVYEWILLNGKKTSPVVKVIGRIDKVLGHRIIKFFADTSYGVYLIHQPFLFCLIPLAIWCSGYEDLTPVFRVVSMTLLTSSIVYAIAFFAFKLIEIPGINLGRKIAKQH